MTHLGIIGAKSNELGCPRCDTVFLKSLELHLNNGKLVPVEGPQTALNCNFKIISEDVAFVLIPRNALCSNARNGYLPSAIFKSNLISQQQIIHLYSFVCIK